MEDVVLAADTQQNLRNLYPLDIYGYAIVLLALATLDDAIQIEPIVMLKNNWLELPQMSN